LLKVLIEGFLLGSVPLGVKVVRFEKSLWDFQSAQNF